MFPKEKKNITHQRNNMSAYDMMNEKKRPVYPTLDEGTYADDVESGIKDAEKKAAEIEKKAKRDRDMALIGDMAHLVAQGGAMHGGAWKIGQTQNESAKGNERLRVLREKNAAQTAAFAKERAALKEAKRKEENAQKLARYNAELEAYKYNKEQERKDKLDALKEAETASAIAKNEAYAKYYNSGGGSGVNRDVFIVKDDGTKEYFRHSESANNLQAAYAKLPSEYKAKKEVKLYDEDDVGRPVLRIDAGGMPVIKLVENINPTLDEMRQAISNYNNRELVEIWKPEDEIIDYKPNN